MVLVDEDFASLFAQASEGEHPNLVSNVVPSARGPQLLEVLPQQGPHFSNPLGYDVPQFSFPLLKVSFIVEDLRGDFSSISTGAGVNLPDNDSE